MGRIIINDLTKNKKLKVNDMLIGHTYRITYTTNDTYDVLVGRLSGEAPYDWYYGEGEKLVIYLANGAIGLINDEIITNIEETNIDLTITN